jgi:hypothetical protein
MEYGIYIYVAKAACTQSGLSGGLTGDSAGLDRRRRLNLYSLSHGPEEAYHSHPTSFALDQQSPPRAY